LRNLQFVSGLFDLATGLQRRRQVVMSSRVLRFPGGKANQIVVLTEGTGSPVAAAKPAPASRP
jgi:hypothetical protein